VRILILDPYVPFPLNRGTFYRAFNLARELGRRHEVDVFCLDDSNSAGHLPVFQEFSRRVHFHPFQNAPWQSLFPKRLLNPIPTTIEHWNQPSVKEAIHDFVKGRAYDLVHFCDLVMWQYVPPMEPRVLRVMDRSRVDLLFQNEELASLKMGFKERLLRHENLWKLRRYEAQVAAEISATVVCGPDDETFLRREVPSAKCIKVLANGVDEAMFRREDFPPCPDPEPTILFCGAMDYSPNVNGLAWYFENCDGQVLKQVPNRKVLVVGKNPVPRIRELARIEGVTVTGEVPDVRPYYQRAWVQMVPLLIGGGTRLKIVESLSIGTPVVSTPIGAQGLALEQGRHILLGTSPGEFATQLVLMLSDTKLRTQIAEEGRKRVLERYTWGMLGEELSRFYQKLAGIA